MKTDAGLKDCAAQSKNVESWEYCNLCIIQIHTALLFKDILEQWNNWSSSKMFSHKSFYFITLANDFYILNQNKSQQKVGRYFLSIEDSGKCIFEIICGWFKT